MQDADLEKYDVEVELTLFTAEEGGRKQGFASEIFGPHIYLDNCEWHARFTLQGRETINPGETVHAYVTFFFRPQALIGRLHPDKSFLLHEGYHPIGKGQILSLLNFERHAQEAKREEEEQNSHLRDYDIEAELSLLTTEQGGRDQGFHSGFRGARLYLDNIHWAVKLYLRDRTIFNPGETARVFVTFLDTYPLLSQLHFGKSFLLKEGDRNIGSGRVLSVLNFERYVEREERLKEEEDSSFRSGKKHKKKMRKHREI